MWKQCSVETYFKKTERERKGCNHIPSEKRLKHANNENLFSKYLLGYICQSKDTSDICQPQNFCVKNGYISVGLSFDISIGLKSLRVENWILVYLIYTIGLS